MNECPTWAEIWDTLSPALLGKGIPTISSGHMRVYAYGKALECLSESWGMTQTEGYALIRHMNNTYQEGPCAIFVTSEADSLEDLPAFSLVNALPKLSSGSTK